jgi:hypothetical protein
MFMLADARSALLVDVIFMGIVSAFVFWVIGGCATLALPAELRFDGAKAFAIPGGIAGMTFQFLYGPGYTLFELGNRPWWGRFAWEHLLLWLIAGMGGGWLFGAGLDRLRHHRHSAPVPRRSRWAVASVISGIAGLAIGALYFVRSSLPLDLFNGLSPAAAAADWLWSWGLLVAALGIVAFIQTLLRPSKHKGWSWPVAGLLFAVVLIFTSSRMAANPWSARFNEGYAEKLLREHGNAGDPEYGRAVYTGNLILAQAALDRDDIAGAGRYLIQAATTPGFPGIEQTGPDTSVARVLLQRGEQGAVLEYLLRFHSIWPQGDAVLTRWENAIAAGRQPNFNNRSPNAGGDNARRREP